jgi:hypothetical protein
MTTMQIIFISIIQFFGLKSFTCKFFFGGQSKKNPRVFISKSHSTILNEPKTLKFGKLIHKYIVKLIY